MMKYIIRFLASLPMLGAGISSMYLTFLAWENAWIAMPAILNWYAFFVCFNSYERTVRHLAVFIKIMAEDALTE